MVLKRKKKVESAEYKLKNENADFKNKIENKMEINEFYPGSKNIVDGIKNKKKKEKKWKVIKHKIITNSFVFFCFFFKLLNIFIIFLRYIYK